VNNGYPALWNNYHLSGSNVVWTGWNSTTQTVDIFLYKNGGITNLTNNPAGWKWNSIHPKVSGSDVVWQAYDGHDWEVHGRVNGTYWQTDNDYDDIKPKVSDSHVVWESDFLNSEEQEIFFRDSTGIISNLTNNDCGDWTPDICGSKVVWVGDYNSGNDRGVFLYDHSTGTTERLTEEGFQLTYYPKVSNDYVIWNANGLFLYDINNPPNSRVIAENQYINDYLMLGDPVTPQISGSYVVWEVYEEPVPEPATLLLLTLGGLILRKRKA
jgi:hypothetical protein